VNAISAVRAAIARILAEWQRVRVADLQFSHGADMRLMLLGAIGLLLVLLIARLVAGRRPERHHIVLPALPASIAPSRGSALAFIPVAIFLVGLLFFAIALGDPRTPFVTRDVSYPGRRIAVVVDASSSMRRVFQGAQRSNAAFYTTVAAARRFVDLRVKGKYRDLMALVEFGNEAYVITPFTNDYDNILLSISLIGDPVEFELFPDSGNTAIGLAV